MTSSGSCCNRLIFWQRLEKVIRQRQADPNETAATPIKTLINGEAVLAIGLTYARQLLAGQHIDDARAAKTGGEGDDALRLGFHFADDTGSGAVRI